jgi:RNA-directed DNA polymerase
MPGTANHARRDRRSDPTRALQKSLYRAAKQNRNRRFHALYDKMHRFDVLERAWAEVARKGGAPGSDGVTIESIEKAGVDGFLRELQAELAQSRYRPFPVRRVTIPKRNGDHRHLGVPAVRDRVVQAAAKIVLEPVFEADFADCSYGFRPRRSAHQALDRIRAGIVAGRKWIVDADIAGFFDSIDHGLLLAMLRERISDRRVLDLIGLWLRAGVFDGQALLHPETGTPQGGVISPLLANVYLNRLDQAWGRHRVRLGEMTRYADDLVIACGSRDRAEAALGVLKRLLHELGLEAHAAKTRIVCLAGGAESFDFLGYTFRMMRTRRNRRRLYAACFPSRAAVAAARDRIRDLTPVDRIGKPLIMIVADLNGFLRGRGNYFRRGNSTMAFRQIDQFAWERLARFNARKHGSRNWRRGMVDLVASRSNLGLIRLAGTVRYPAAHATG